MDHFLGQHGNNHLISNVNTTKEVIVDFRRTRNKSNSISIVEEVEVVEEYKYLVHLDNKLEWRFNTDAVYKKGQSRLYFLRKIRSFECLQQDVAYLR